MKKLLFVLVAFATFTINTFGQSPDGFNYQAVIRNASNAIVSNQAVGLRMTLQQGTIGGATVYSETFAVTTNTNGLVNVQIGNGSVLSGTFATINWANGPYFIETAVDATGGMNYVVMGTSQLMSVPYALYAKTSGNGQGPVGPQGPAGATGATGPQGVPGAAGPQGATGLLTSGAVAGNTPYWNGSAWVVNNSNIHNNGAGVGIGTATPNASAKVEIASTTQGFLPPRMTTAQRDAITSPSIGLVIYNTNTGCLNYFVGGGWIQTCGSAEQPIVQPAYPAGSVFCPFPTPVVNVVNPATGKIWMDRNLGAFQAATYSTDAQAYGDLYQWGRSSDGHQCRNSATTTTLSSTDQPGNGNFILATSTPFDWRSPQNTNLWQGVNGVNNPCPSGYRLPTETELDAERLSWISNDIAGAFASPLRLPAAGYRYNSGSLSGVNVTCQYWSSGVSSIQSRALYFSISTFMNGTISLYRAYGCAVRCIKN